MEHTRLFAAGNLAKKSPKRPNWYLLDRVWEEPVVTAMPPVFLSGLEQDECRRSGIAMVQVRAPDGLFRIMRKDEAGRCGMEIVRDW